MKFPWNSHEIHGDIWRLSCRIFSKTWRLTCWKLAGPKEKCKPSRHSTTSQSHWRQPLCAINADVQGAKPWNCWNMLEPLVLKVAFSAKKKVFPQVMAILGATLIGKCWWTMRFSAHPNHRRTWPEPRSGRTCHGHCAVSVRDLKIPWFYHTVQDRAPSYKLVYKPWNNPHEYYSYIMLYLP